MLSTTEMILWLLGPGGASRGSIAKELGVNECSVGRWLAESSHPRARHAKAIEQLYRRTLAARHATVALGAVPHLTVDCFQYICSWATTYLRVNPQSAQAVLARTLGTLPAMVASTRNPGFSVYVFPAEVAEHARAHLFSAQSGAHRIFLILYDGRLDASRLREALQAEFVHVLNELLPLATTAPRTHGPVRGQIGRPVPPNLPAARRRNRRRKG